MEILEQYQLRIKILWDILKTGNLYFTNAIGGSINPRKQNLISKTPWLRPLSFMLFPIWSWSKVMLTQKNTNKQMQHCTRGSCLYCDNLTEMLKIKPSRYQTFLVGTVELVLFTINKGYSKWRKFDQHSSILGIEHNVSSMCTDIWGRELEPTKMSSWAKLDGYSWAT